VKSPQLGRGARILESVNSFQKSHFRPEVFTNHTSKGITVIPKKVIALCAVVGVAVSGFALAVPAHADPVAESFSIVGSDTLEDVVGALIQGTSITGSPVRSLVNNAASGSFDATGSVTLITKPNGKRFGRPNGSSDGIKALLASMTTNMTFVAKPQLYPNSGLAGGTVAMGIPAAVTIPGEVDMARSSSASTVVPSGSLTQVPFGRDAVGYVYDSASTFVGIENLTSAQLKDVFEGILVQDANGVTLKAATPQTGSGTGKDWPGMIGATIATVKAAAENKSNGNYYSQEHDASALGINTVQPMSASRWIAMHSGGSYAKYVSVTGTGAHETRMGAIKSLGALPLDSSDDVIVSPVIDNAGVLTPNPAFYNSTVDGRTFGRETYILVQTLRITPGTAADPNLLYDANLADLLDVSKSTSLANNDTRSASRSGSVKKKFGFLPPLSETPTQTNG
jgi:hypothetical protein